MTTHWLRNLGLAAALALAAPVAMAQDVTDADEAGAGDTDRLRLHEQDFDQLRIYLRKKVKLSDAEIDALEPACTRYFRQRGEQEHIQAMIRTGWEEGCRGECMQEMVRSTTRAMVWGVQDVEATEMVQTALREQLRERTRMGANWTDAELGDRLHDRVQTHLRTWERDHERLMEQDRLHEQEREQLREREREGEHKGAGPKGSGS
jgi:hypothetical protein